VETSPGTDPEIRWDEARRFLRGRLAYRVRGIPADELEDLTQEALIRLLRVVRREGVRNLEALMNHIVELTRNDFLKRKMRRQSREQPLDDLAHVVSDPAGDAASHLEAIEQDPSRLAFLVLEFVRRVRPGALSLCESKMRGRSLEETAREQGRTPAAVRKEWSRVAQQFRDYWAAHPEEFGGSAVEEGGA
jgi:DNA-directed RNA polymerase specialized sigma24 family protein